MKSRTSLIERIGHKIPDPVVIFLFLYVIAMLLSALFGGYTFTAPGTGNTTYTIKNMFETQHVRWIFSGAILSNWLGYAGGILGSILVVMFGIGIAEESGLLSALIRRSSSSIHPRFLPYVLVFLGIMSNIASDAGYLILIPLAGLLYAGIGKHPLIGMAAAFAGVSAGFSANLIPATFVDVVVGTNAQSFAEAQNIPFVSYTGKPLNPMTMHYYFLAFSTLVLVFLGGFITNKWVVPRFEGETFTIPDDIRQEDFSVSRQEKKGLLAALLGFLLAIILCFLLAIGPLKSYVDDQGKTVTPFLDHIILLITFIFFVPGLFYGYYTKKFKKSGDVIQAMSKQMGSMGYVIVLTFFSYNFLALLSYSNLGSCITYFGAKGLQALGLSQSPLLLLIGFVLITSVVNLFVGGLTSKWMLLGPIFIPMLYHVNPNMTPDVVAAAYRVADSSTNIITPLMTYAGIVLLYMRKYKPSLSVGDLIGLMFPYSMAFLVIWTLLLIGFFLLKIPLGF